MRGFLRVSAFALFRNARIARRASFSRSGGSRDLILRRHGGIEFEAARFLRKPSNPEQFLSPEPVFKKMLG
jgi:hypothetical protein